MVIKWNNKYSVSISRKMNNKDSKCIKKIKKNFSFSVES